MSQSYKLLVFGSTALEVEAVLVLMSQAMKGSEVAHGEIAGSRVSRFSGHEKREDGPKREFTVYGVSMEADFRGVFRLLGNNADGAIGLIPADSARVVESKKVLAALQRVLEMHREEGKKFPFVIQYHGSSQEVNSSPEELDGLLGINPQGVTRCCSQADGQEVDQGLIALFDSLQRLKSSPK